VIFRKVTNGLRSEWGADTYAAFRSVVSTAKANGRSALGDLRNVLAAPSAKHEAAQPGFKQLQFRNSETLLTVMAP